uniref:ABC1 atypical kinase-like domain-containing protein n=1 Tax=Chenopodium quinoa TaxID=63459 RepID=A0A803N1B0_CHEQI
MGWGNIYKRRIKVFTLALIIYLDYKALQKRSKWIKNKTKKAAVWKKAHERNARRILNFMIQMEGLWVKLGQYLSTRADVLPEAYIRNLQQLQDSLPPRPLDEVCHTIEKEMGKPVEELFLKFVEVPLATASIAQVHRATLQNGQEVVVKVQHEGIKQVILEDLKNAKAIVEWIAWAEPVYNFNPMIDEWCREAPKELDLNIEAENTRKVASNLGCDKTNKDSRGTNSIEVLIPEVIQSTEKVIILEYMDGVRLSDVEALQALGNFLVSKEYPHRPILLDFGLTKSLPETTKQALAKMLLAAAEAMEVTTIFFRNSTPASEAAETLKNFSEERAKKMKALQEKMKLDDKEAKRFSPVDAFPGDIVIFARVLNLLRGLSATMEVRIVYFDIMRPFAESVLGGIINMGPATNTQWLCDTPVHSDVEGKLRKLLIDLGNAGKILGIQVCAYKDGEVIIDTAAGALGKYDPRPVQLDSLFPVFSVTKGITAGLLH